MTADGATVPLDARPWSPAADGDRARQDEAPAHDGRSDAAPDRPGVTRLIYGRHVRVLLVEPDDDEAGWFLTSAEESVLDVHVDVEHGVEEAVARLERHLGPRWRRHLPDIVVSCLDVDDSHRLLTVLRQDSRFDAVPLIVLSEEPTPALERRSFALGAAGHLRTPRRAYERVALVHALPDFIPSARAAHAEIESRR